MEKPVLPEEYMMYRGKTPEAGVAEVSEAEGLMKAFEAHEDEEKVFIKRYREIAETSDNPFVKFMLNLIISDEEKHQAITRAIVATLKGSIEWSYSKDVISGLYELGEVKSELLEITKDFLRLERRGIKDYEKLIKECDGYYQGLFGLLVRGMIRDSEKHAEMLGFLRDRLEKA